MEIQVYKDAFLDFLKVQLIESKDLQEPENLFEPIRYILQLGGKRLRPVLTLMGCDVFGRDYQSALDAALAIEMFHNFTLMHDDIMDAASIRRGKVTVHKKWNTNTAILSGDALMILAYQYFENYEGDTFKKIVSLFNKTALEVCVGQQYDMDFETRPVVSLPEYKKMIGFKTAVLTAAALKMGAIIAGAEKKQCDLIYDFGFNLGMAFQLQDDYLDTFGTEEFGKKIGGDITENKKTFLFIKTLELASDEDRKILEKTFDAGTEPGQKIRTVTSLYKKYRVDDLIREEIRHYSEKAFNDVNALNISEKNKFKLNAFAEKLMGRKL